MTHEQIIEYLKQNTTIYDLWPEEVRRVADGIERKYFLLHERGRFQRLRDDPDETLEETGYWSSVYRLSPDYQSPKKAGKWVEYDVGMNAVGLWQVKEDSRGDFIQGFILHEACVKRGFGGILYEDCECSPEPLKKWWMFPPAPCEKHGPYKPLKVRFWEVG